MANPDVSIIIVSYNTREFLSDCLRSLIRVSDEAACDIIVVDNASQDDSARMVEDDFPHVRLIRAGKNLGFAAANNLGMAAAQGMFMFFLNPDTLVCRFTLQRLLGFMHEHPQTAVAGAALTHPDGRPQPSSFKFPSLFREFWNFLPEFKAFFFPPRLRFHGHFKSSASLAEPGGHSAPQRVDCVSGAAMMVRGSALKEIGGFDEQFFLYHEEMDLCTRLRSKGWEVWSVPEAQVIHFDGQASGYRPNCLPRMPLLGWRVLGMERLWKKHTSRHLSRLWRAQARGLLRVRAIALLMGSTIGGKHRVSVEERVRELRELCRKLVGERE